MDTSKSNRKKNGPKASRKSNKATQTVDSGISTEIINLQKQMELLQLEIDTLRKQVPTSTKADNDNAVHVLSIDQTQKPKINIKVTICGCKGDCSSRRCGCMKENNKCTASCKCNSEICQNQEEENQNEKLDQEDKENISMNGMATPIKQEALTQDKIVMKTKGNNLASDKIINQEQFDPMKPRHQLSRTPVKMNKSVVEEIHMDNIHQPQSPAIMASSFNINGDVSNLERVVDWVQHTAQLIPCKKCNRTFMPHRLEKHEACCKKV